MKKQFCMIKRTVKTGLDMSEFTDTLSAASSNGFSVESCGVNGDSSGCAWAIMSKPNEAPKQIDLVEAARQIASLCKGKDGCEGCPLSRNNQCMASGGRGSVIPAWWAIAGEEK